MHTDLHLEIELTAATAKINRNRIKQNVSKLFAVTRFTPNIIVL